MALLRNASSINMVVQNKLMLLGIALDLSTLALWRQTFQNCAPIKRNLVKSLQHKIIAKALQPKWLVKQKI